MSVIVGCAIIVALLAAGIWISLRFAREAIRESRDEAFRVQQDLARSVQQGMTEAAIESAQLETDEDAAAAVEAEPEIIPSHEQMTAAWMQQVNEFIAREVLSAGAGSGTADEGSPTLLEALHRAAAQLETGEARHPAVEAAIRTTLASSLLNLEQVDDAADQCIAALELLRRGFGEMHDYTMQARRNLGAVRLRQGDFDDAAMIYQVLYEMRLAAGGPDDPATAETLRIARLLRDEAALIAPDAAPAAMPVEIRELIERPPTCCRFQPLEF